MKSSILCSVFLFMAVVQSENIEAVSDGSNKDSILLRKLQLSITPSITTLTASGNEMLAGIMVDYLKSLYITVKKKLLRKNLYKEWVYDKLHPRTDEPQIETDKDTEGSGHPKDDVELVEPRYHGKLCSSENGCSTTGDTKIENAPPTLEIRENRGIKCPEGNVVDAEGNCVDAEMDRYIMWVPNHCPDGYKADRRGNCRRIMKSD